MTQRTLLAEIGENAKWDTGSSLGTGIAISSDGKTASRAGAVVNSSARTLLPRVRGKTFVAWLVNSHGAPAQGVWAGLATQDGPNNVSTGFSDQQWALWSGNGGAGSKQHNNVNTAYASGVPVGQWMLAAIDFDLGSVWFGKATALSGGVVTWFGGGDPAAGTSADYTDLLTSGTVRNSIARKFYLICNPVGGGGSSLSIVSDRRSLATICPAGFTPYGEFAYISDGGYCSNPSDTPPNQYYAGRISEGKDPEIDRTVSVRQWQRSGATGMPIGSCDLNDPDGRLDVWLKYDLRDMPVRWRMGSPVLSLSTFTDVGYSVIERFDNVDEYTKRIVHKDTLGLLDASWQKTLYTSSTPNSTLEGKPLPVAFGLCTWCPLTTADLPNLEYHLTDDEWGGVLELRDQGVVITAFTGWDYGSRTDAVGVRRLTNPAGRQSATIRGQVNLGADVLGGIGAFTTWAADNPSGFTVTETGPSLVTQTIAGIARFVRSTAVTLQAVTPGNVLTNAQLYYMTIQCTSWVSGALLVKDGAGNTLLTITKAGTYRVGFVAAATTTLGLYMTANGDVSVDNWLCYPATLVERITTIVPYIVRDRMGLDATLYDTSNLSTLDGLAAYKHGFFDTAGKRAVDVLADVMTGYTGFMWVDRLNRLKVGRLAVPALVGSEPEFTDIELFGDIRVEPDLAPGLSNRLAGVRNYSPHSDTDIAGSLLSAGSGQVAAQLKEEWLAIKSSTTPLAGAYAFAKTNPPTPTLLSDATQVQTEMNRIAALWNVQRAFYYFQAFVDGGQGYLLEPGTIIKLTSDRYGLTSGLAVVLISIKSRFLSDLVTFVGWGAKVSLTDTGDDT